LDLPSSEQFVPSPVEEDKKGKPGKFNQSKAEREMAKATEIVKNELKKKKISKTEAEAIASIEQAQADVVDIKGDGVPFGKCIVMRKLTDKVMEQDWYPFHSHWDGGVHRSNAIAAGRRMGAILAQRLQVRNDPMTTKQTRLPNGNIDRRLLAQLGMDIEQVFHKSRVDQHRPAMLHLTLDGSGSMSGEKWNKVLTVATAIAYVGSKIRNVDTVISVRGGSEIPIVSVVFDSRRDQFNTLLRHLKRLSPNGATPEGLCYKATLDLIMECTDTHDVYFINFSDGEPSFSYTTKSSLSSKESANVQYMNYGGEMAAKHTRAMMNRMRERGVKVLSYFISENGTSGYYTTTAVNMFKIMYGENASFVNVKNTSEVLRTLNKLLLNRGT
jgi:nitric oxide reductase activation protein